ncbi:metallophosphoesterase, partial [Micrococcus luteus]|uniref:metallophosphoesterase n=2 Tax=Micrococcaceae TaxID=1268 RepID=UPI000665DBF5
MRPAASPARRMFRAAAPAAAGLAATAGLGLAWGLAEAEARTVRTHRLAVLPAGSAPLRVLHLSDIHLLPRHRAKRAWLRGLDALEPDLVVNTGDNVSAAASVPLVLDALGPLLARPGVFVPGSNDYYAPKAANPLRYFAGPSRMDADRPRLPSDVLFGAFRVAGWADLTNRGAALAVPTRAGTTLEVLAAGTDDPHLGLDAWAG